MCVCVYIYIYICKSINFRIYNGLFKYRNFV
jgi:hypothetical protein